MILVVGLKAVLFYFLFSYLWVSDIVCVWVLCHLWWSWLTSLGYCCCLLSKQVFVDNAFEKFGKWFISLHFSDQHPASYRKILVFKSALWRVNDTAYMTRLIMCVPSYIDFIFGATWVYRSVINLPHLGLKLKIAHYFWALAPNGATKLFSTYWMTSMFQN